MQEFACVCEHFRSINGTVESAHFIQISNLIASLRIICPKNPLEIEKNYLLPPLQGYFAAVVHLICVLPRNKKQMSSK